MALHRKERISDLVREEVGKILQRELDFDFDALVTVTRADVSENRAHAKIYVSAFPSSFGQKVLEEINKQIYFLQQYLNKNLRIRPVPKLFFVLDETEERAAKIEKLIEETKK